MFSGIKLWAHGSQAASWLMLVAAMMDGMGWEGFSTWLKAMGETPRHPGFWRSLVFSSIYSLVFWVLELWASKWKIPGWPGLGASCFGVLGGTYVLFVVSWLLKPLAPSSLERKMGETEGGEHVFGTSFKQKSFCYSGRRPWCKQSDGKSSVRQGMFFRWLSRS